MEITYAIQAAGQSSISLPKDHMKLRPNAHSRPQSLAGQPLGQIDICTRNPMTDPANIFFTAMATTCCQEKQIAKDFVFRDSGAAKQKKYVKGDEHFGVEASTFGDKS
jgi:hypothetical protein